MPLGYVNRVSGSWLGLRWGIFTCVWWQVTLRDPMWQVTTHNSVMGLVSLRAIRSLLNHYVFFQHPIWLFPLVFIFICHLTLIFMFRMSRLQTTFNLPVNNPADWYMLHDDQCLSVKKFYGLSLKLLVFEVQCGNPGILCQIPNIIMTVPLMSKAEKRYIAHCIFHHNWFGVCCVLSPVHPYVNTFKYLDWSVLDELTKKHFNMCSQSEF